jgi:hypothetical protein
VPVATSRVWAAPGSNGAVSTEGGGGWAGFSARGLQAARVATAAITQTTFMPHPELITDK